MNELSRRSFLASLAAVAGATTLPVAAVAAMNEPPLDVPSARAEEVDDAEQQVDEVSSQWGHRRRVVRRVYRRGYRRGYYGGGYGYPSYGYGGGYYRPGYGSVYRHRRRVVRRAYRRRW
jgi:hypothetical protein